MSYMKNMKNYRENPKHFGIWRKKSSFFNQAYARGVRWVEASEVFDLCYPNQNFHSKGHNFFFLGGGASSSLLLLNNFQEF